MDGRARGLTHFAAERLGDAHCLRVAPAKTEASQPRPFGLLAARPARVPAKRGRDVHSVWGS